MRTFVARYDSNQSKTACTEPEAGKAAPMHRLSIVHLRYMYKHINSNSFFS